MPTPSRSASATALSVVWTPSTTVCIPVMTSASVNWNSVLDGVRAKTTTCARGTGPLQAGVVSAGTDGSTRTSLIAEHAPAVVELAYRLRIMGSLALSLCHLAAGRVDAVCSLKPARSVDIAAAQLLCREVGLAIELFDDQRDFGEAELDLEGRSRVAAAGTADLCRQVAAALSA